MVNNLYSDLQVAPNAHPEVIKAAYRALCKIYHPDQNPDDQNTEIIQRVNVAYNTLSCPKSRRDFDAQLDGLVGLDEDDDFKDQEDAWIREEEELRFQAEEYIAAYLDLNGDDRMALSSMTDEQLIDIMESFKRKPRADLFPKLILGIVPLILASSYWFLA